MQTVILFLDYLTEYHLQCSAPDGLKRRMIRDENGTHFDRPSPLYDQKEFVPLEVKSGDFVVIHGDLVHQR
jgi:phytanoyl-CoA hydroxylase